MGACYSTQLPVPSSDSNNEEEWIGWITQHKKQIQNRFRRAPAKFRSDKHFMLKLYDKIKTEYYRGNVSLHDGSSYGECLEHCADDNLKDDPEIILAACRAKTPAEGSRYTKKWLSSYERNDWPVKYASDRLRNDRTFIYKACKIRIYSLAYASETIRTDKDFVWKLFKLDLDPRRRLGHCQSLTVLRFCAQSVRDDLEIQQKYIEWLATVGDPYRAFPGTAPKEWLQAKEMAMKVVKLDGMTLRSLSNKLQDDREIVLTACKRQYGFSSHGPIQYASKRLRNDADLLLEGIRYDEQTFQILSDKLRNRKEFVLTACQIDGCRMLGAASPKFQDDKDVVLEACKNCSVAFHLASTRLRGDRDMVMQVGIQGRNDDGDYDGCAIPYAADEIHQDKDFLVRLCQKRGVALAHIRSEKLKDDKDVVMAACQQCGVALEFASERLRDDEDVVRAAVHQDPLAMQHVSQRFQNDKGLIYSSVQRNGSILEFVSEILQNDDDVVQAAVQQNGSALIFASQRLKDNKDIVLVAVKQNGLLLEKASATLQNDVEVVSAAIHQNASALEFASSHCKDNKSLVQMACREDATLLEHASDNLKDDNDIVLEACRQNGTMLKYASKRLQDLKDVVLVACQQDASAFHYASDRLRADKGIVLVVVSADPYLLKFALGGLNQDRDCLIAGKLWDDDYYHSSDRKIVLSTRFSLAPESWSQASHFAVLLKNHPYIQAGNFTVYSPNAFDKSTCDPEWTRFDWPCRGTFETCRFDNEALKTGVPQPGSCWRYSFRHQLDEAKTSRGFMIQLVERQSLGDGQTIEKEMAEDLQTKVFRVYTPILHTQSAPPLFGTDFGCNNSHEFKTFQQEEPFTEEDIKIVVSDIRQWYQDGCKDMSESTIRITHYEAVRPL